MGGAQADECVERLLRAAQEAGFSVTRAQLHRWQQAGLLPKPRQRGRGWGKGTEVLYPPGSSTQLVALCEQLQNKRSLDAACWGLWWDRYPVSEQQIRDLFERKVAKLEAYRATAEKEGLQALVNKRDSTRLTDPLLSQMYQRVGREDWSVLLKILAKTVAGIDPELTDDDAKRLSERLGLPAAEGLRERFRVISHWMSPANFREALGVASPDDLAKARDSLRTVLELLGTVVVVLEAVIGREFAQPIMDDLQRPSHNLGTHLLLHWLSLTRTPKGQQLYANLHSILQAVAKGDFLPAHVMEADLTPELIHQGPEESSNE